VFGSSSRDHNPLDRDGDDHTRASSGSSSSSQRQRQQDDKYERLQQRKQQIKQTLREDSQQSLADKFDALRREVVGLVAYLRRSYSYCFFCGVKYNGEADMSSQCPGADEDAH